MKRFILIPAQQGGNEKLREELATVDASEEKRQQNIERYRDAIGSLTRKLENTTAPQAANTARFDQEIVRRIEHGGSIT